MNKQQIFENIKKEVFPLRGLDTEYKENPRRFADRKGSHFRVQQSDN